jgi:hypothetical protein
MARRDGVIAGLRPEWTVDGCSDELFLVVDGRFDIVVRGLLRVRLEDKVRRAPAKSVRCGSCDGENSNSGKTAPGVAFMISSRRRRASARSLVRSDLAMRPAV